MGVPCGVTEECALAAADAVGEEARQARRALVDPAAFAPLYQRRRPQVYALCYRAVGNAPDAEDLTSQVFHKAFARLETFAGGSFEKWLITIAVNVIRDFRRTECRLSALPAERPDPRPGPEEEAVRADERGRLHALLATLSADEREVVELRLAGYRGAEIAQLLGRSPEAVRKAQSRALQRLAQRLGLDEAAGGLGGTPR